MIVESIKHNPESSKLVNTPHSPALTGYIKVDLQKAWVNFIEKFEPYRWFVTLTFKDETHPEQADKRYFRWIRHINEVLYGKRWREHQEGTTWFKAVEYQDRGTLHFHCLLGGEVWKLKRLDWMKAWETNCMNTHEVVNGFARIFEYDYKQGAISYVSKYVFKNGGEIDMNISPAQQHLLDNKDRMLIGL